MISFISKKNKSKNNQVKSLEDYIEQKHCLCFFSVTTKTNQMKIVVNEDESSSDELAANELFEMYKNTQRSVHLYNYRAGLYKFYNRNTGRIIQRKIENKTKRSVNIDILIATINYIGSEYENKQIPPKYFSIIYKLLIDEIIGSGYKDIKGTTFRNMMKKYGFVCVGRSSFSKHKPHGKYPNWSYDDSQFTKDKNEKVNEALTFATNFKKVYDEIMSNNLIDETIETAEETAE